MWVWDDKAKWIYKIKKINGRNSIEVDNGDLTYTSLVFEENRFLQKGSKIMNTVVENRIYSGWAFTENEREKAKVNRSIYEQLRSKYKVYRHDLKINLIDGQDLKFDDYDVIIGRKPCYLHGEYKVYKNKPNLTKDELALLCDTGNLCFGYRTMGTNGFYVFED